MKIFIVRALLAVALLPLVAEAAPLQISTNVFVDVLESVPTRELWNAAKPDVVEAGAAIVDSRMFDPEARPRNGMWYGCAIVMIGTSDLGIKPVAVRIWTARPCEVTVTGAASSSPRLEAEFNVHVGLK